MDHFLPSVLSEYRQQRLKTRQRRSWINPFQASPPQQAPAQQVISLPRVVQATAHSGHIQPESESRGKGKRRRRRKPKTRGGAGDRGETMYNAEVAIPLTHAGKNHVSRDPGLGLPTTVAGSTRGGGSRSGSRGGRGRGRGSTSGLDAGHGASVQQAWGWGWGRGIHPEVSGEPGNGTPARHDASVQQGWGRGRGFIQKFWNGS